jgi:hypothetical protein
LEQASSGETHVQIVSKIPKLEINKRAILTSECLTGSLLAAENLST